MICDERTHKSIPVSSIAKENQEIAVSDHHDGGRSGPAATEKPRAGLQECIVDNRITSSTSVIIALSSANVLSLRGNWSVKMSRYYSKFRSFVFLKTLRFEIDATSMPLR